MTLKYAALAALFFAANNADARGWRNSGFKSGGKKNKGGKKGKNKGEGKEFSMAERIAKMEERHASLVAACPTEAVECGLPDSLPFPQLGEEDPQPAFERSAFAWGDGEAKEALKGTREAMKDAMQCLMSIPEEEVSPSCAEELADIKERKEAKEGGRGGRGKHHRIKNVGEVLEICETDIELTCSLGLEFDLEDLQATLADYKLAREQAKEDGVKPERLPSEVKDMLKEVRSCLHNDVKPLLADDSECLAAISKHKPGKEEDEHEDDVDEDEDDADENIETEVAGVSGGK